MYDADVATHKASSAPNRIQPARRVMRQHPQPLFAPATRTVKGRRTTPYDVTLVATGFSSSNFRFPVAFCDSYTYNSIRSHSDPLRETMGRPILKICAMKGCDVTDCTDLAHNAGVHFSVQSCLAKGVKLDAQSQVRFMHFLLSVFFHRKPSCRPRMLTHLERDFCSFGRAVQNTKTARCNWSWKACLTEIASISLSLTTRSWAQLYLRGRQIQQARHAALGL